MYYILAPKGFTCLATLENDIDTRFRVLLKVYESGDRNSDKLCQYLKSSVNLSSNIDGLIEGSRRDCASHFIFRLACLPHGQMQDYWIKAEERLFRYRLASGGNYFVHKSLKRLHTDILKLSPLHKFKGNENLIFVNIKETVENLLHMPSFVGCENIHNCDHNLNVPWILVKNLVSQRKVELQDGKAKISCSLLSEFLVAVFRELLLLGISQMKSHNLKIEDARILYIFERIHHHFFSCQGSYGLSRAKQRLISYHIDVENEYSKFPLCMQQFQTQLVTKHRIRHDERFRYSLFLKDIGLPLEQNILFWKKYYSRATKCSSGGCTHIWEGTQAKRFEYSLRHMYGQEGRRVSYRAYSCSALQGMAPQPQEAGGCPFKHLNEVHLRKLLGKSQFLWNEQTEAIVRASKDEDAAVACGYYLSALLHRHKRPYKKFARVPSAHSALYDNGKGRTSYQKFRKTKSSFDAGEMNKASDNTLMQDLVSKTAGEKTERPSCVGCNYNAICPELSYLSPVDYFRLTKQKLIVGKKL